MKKIVSFIFIISVFLIILTGCEMSPEAESTLEDKITSEIQYMERNLIEILNKIALDEYEDNKLQEDTRKLEEASNRIMVDLASKNIDNNELTRLSDGINNMLIAVASGDENAYLVELNNVFSLFPNYEAKISDSSEDIFERRLKYFTVSTFVSYSIGDLDLAKLQVDTLESEYLEKQKDIEYVEKHKYNLNKIYLLIEELKKAVETDSSEIVKEKYLLLINEI